MYHFHVTLTSDHPYKTNPWSWLIQGRPTSFFYETKTRGQDGCAVAQCSKAITSIGTPTLWWGATAAIFVLLAMWALRRDWRAGAVLAGLVAGYVPWFAFQHRTIYSFYAVAFVPWVVLAVTYVIGMVLGPPDGVAATTAGRRRDRGLVRRRLRDAVLLLLADLHRPGDPVRAVGAADVVPELDLTDCGERARTARPRGLGENVGYGHH